MDRVAAISSAIAAALLEKRLREGATIEIPSIGVTLGGTPMDDEAMRRRFVEAVLQTCRAEDAQAAEDAEVARILSLSDEEILAEAHAEGIDPEQNAIEMRAIFERARSEAHRRLDLRAATEVLGWQWQTAGSHQILRTDKGRIAAVNRNGIITIWSNLPSFGSDPAAALSLLAAVPPERRAAVGARLLRALGYEPATATMVLLSFEDVWRLVVEATPQRIRDAVMEGME